MKLRQTEVRYEMKDESGYNFDVVCTNKVDGYGQDCGWTAVVQMKTSGSTTAEEALKHLGLSAKAFLSHLKEMK